MPYHSKMKSSSEVQIILANMNEQLYSWPSKFRKVTNAAEGLRQWCCRSTFFCSSPRNVWVKKILKSVHVCQSDHTKNCLGFFYSRCIIITSAVIHAQMAIDEGKDTTMHSLCRSDCGRAATTRGRYTIQRHLTLSKATAGVETTHDVCI